MNKTRTKDSVINSKEFFSYVIKSICCVSLCLFTIDILINFLDFKRMFLQKNFLCFPSDFLGLFLSNLQIGLFVFFLSFVLTSILNYKIKKLNFRYECIILQSSILIGLSIFINLYIIKGLSIYLNITILMILITCSWIVYHFLLKKHDKDSWTLYELIEIFLFPALIIGIFNNTVHFILTRHLVGVIVFGILLFLIIGNIIILFKLNSQKMKYIFVTFPFLIAILIIIQSCINSLYFGENTDTISKTNDDYLPNIVLIVLDTVRADHLKIYGYERDTMPLLESWSNNALIFKRAFSPAGWTSPAHASFFSGKTVSIHGIHFTPKKSGPMRTNPIKNIYWLPENLTENGYYCLAVTANSMAIPKEKIGFHRIFNPQRDLNNSLGAIFDGFLPSIIRSSEYIRWRTPYTDIKEMIKIIERSIPRNDGPKFLFVNFMDAHDPYAPPREALKELNIRLNKSYPRYIRWWRWVNYGHTLPKDKIQHLYDLYDGELRWIDKNLINFLNWIEKNMGLNTLIIITSDHGEELGEKGDIGHYSGLSQRILHVPLIISHSTLPKGMIEKVVSTRNIFKFIQHFGNNHEPSIDFLTINDEYGVISERYRTKRYPELPYRDWISIINDEYKVVGPSKYKIEIYNTNNEELIRDFNLINLYETNKIIEKIDNYWESYEDKRNENKKLQIKDKDEIDKLRALGYI